MKTLNRIEKQEENRIGLDLTNPCELIMHLQLVQILPCKEKKEYSADY